MSRPADSYRGARRNAHFGRKPVGNTWPRLPRERMMVYETQRRRSLGKKR